MKKRIKFNKSWGKVVGAVIGVTIALGIVRVNGWLQPLEWRALDLFFQIRPLEPIDERIVIVGVTEQDIQKYHHPLSDEILARLLDKIRSGQPSAIGLDFYRDLPVGDGYSKLARVFETTPNLLGVQKFLGEGVNPSPILKQKGQITFSDVVVDNDGVLRRGILLFEHRGILYSSLGTELAIRYLQEKGIHVGGEGEALRVGNVKFYPLQGRDGGYQNFDARGFQILINFRNPKTSFQTVSVSEVLENKVEPNLFRDRLVLIGSTAASLQDDFYTPFSHSFNYHAPPVHGVEIQAAIASHFLSASLDRRMFFHHSSNLILEEVFEYVFIFTMGIITALCLCCQRHTKDYLVLFGKVIGIFIFSVIVLFVSSYYLFVSGFLLPFVPALIELSAVTIVVILLILIQKNNEMQLMQEQLIEERKQAALSTLVVGAVHEINNPLQSLINLANLNLISSKRLKQEIQNRLINSSTELLEKIVPAIESFETKSRKILERGQKVGGITQSLLGIVRQGSLELTLSNINDLVDSILRVVTYGKQGDNDGFELTLETSYDSKIGEKKIVVEDFEQILVNLIGNACDAVFERRIKVGSQFQPLIVVTTQMLDEALEISIRDNGEGISPDIADNIYEPFTTTKASGKGTGLGLYITHELVQRNQGQIRWEREEGMTKFIVTFSSDR